MQLRQPSQYWCGGNEAHALTGALRKADQAKELLVWSARTSRSVPFTHSGRVRDCVTGGAWGTCITTGRDMRGTVRCQSWRGLALLKTLAVCGEGWCCRHRQCWNDRNEDSGCLCATICCRRITYEGRVHKIMGKHTRNITYTPPPPPPTPHTEHHPLINVTCSHPPTHTHTHAPPPPPPFHTHTHTWRMVHSATAPVSKHDPRIMNETAEPTASQLSTPFSPYSLSESNFGLQILPMKQKSQQDIWSWNKNWKKNWKKAHIYTHTHTHTRLTPQW